MRAYSFVLLIAITLTSTLQAGVLDFGGGHHGKFGRGSDGGLGGFGLFGVYSAEATQSRFEDTFAELTTTYDTGLAGIEDYYNSDEYGDVVDDVQLLSDRYDFFLSTVDRAIDRFDSLLTNLTTDISYFDELLAQYQTDEDLSDERLERIETWITSIQDLLTLKVDYLTEKQSVLEENYATYTAFGDEIDAYLNNIVTAGGGLIDEESATSETTALALASSGCESMAALLADPCASLPLESVVVPEPSAAILLGLAITYATSRRFRFVS